MNRFIAPISYFQCQPVRCVERLDRSDCVRVTMTAYGRTVHHTFPPGATPESLAASQRDLLAVHKTASELFRCRHISPTVAQQHWHAQNALAADKAAGAQYRTGPRRGQQIAQARR